MADKKLDGRTKEAKEAYNSNPDLLRRRIQTGKILTRVQQHSLGMIDMKPSELSAAKLLLDKAMPSMQAVQSEISETKSFVVHTPMNIPGDDQWEKAAVDTVKALEKAKKGNV